MSAGLFEEGTSPFSFAAHGVTLHCEPLSIPGYVAFRVVFSSERKPIVVARARGEDRALFWTSVPEGRQQEAEGVGRLIEDYLRDNK